MATQSTKAAVENFVGQHKLAVVGVSRDTKKFGNAAYKALKEKGYQVYPINRNVETIEGDRCYASLGVLPEKVDGVLIVVPPTETERVVREADALVRVDANLQEILSLKGAPYRSGKLQDFIRAKDAPQQAAAAGDSGPTGEPTT